jgi:hypothetical protein
MDERNPGTAFIPDLDGRPCESMSSNNAPRHLQSSGIPVTTISTGAILDIRKIIFHYSEFGLGENGMPV